MFPEKKIYLHYREIALNLNYQGFNPLSLSIMFTANLARNFARALLRSTAPCPLCNCSAAYLRPFHNPVTSHVKIAAVCADCANTEIV